MVQVDEHHVVTATGDSMVEGDGPNLLGVWVKAEEEVALKMIPRTTMKIESKSVPALLRLLDTLEENDDVQNVFSNADISDEDMEAAMAD